MILTIQKSKGFTIIEAIVSLAEKGLILRSNSKKKCKINL